ncbi:T9SS type A sorting domain-containing protein [Hymenobacter sp. HDW8]|uniref:T9SS type A sorting domain-containing protein n=1 Tax=Hymenobacter sp. HDW8 TaxID=2714932 RepID=UPI00140A815A|nr:T9SS type A sorting domain-containing protein [Hymenobacter sp. HDW8]QIL74795.1 T9SS type A sorting domain-containing protein [Hymenobacter sp. HDW8]
MKKLFLPCVMLFTTAENGSSKVSSANKFSTGFLQKATWRVALTFVAFLLTAGTSFAQVVLPSEDRCTSKDLELVSARLNVPACQSCEANSLITAPLLLAIDNKTGSTRTSFAFWGDIVIKNSAGVVTYQAEVTGCNGKIEKNTTTELPYDVVQIRVITDLSTSGSGISSTGQITYECGSTLDLTNLFLAWTDASPKSTCSTLKSELIAPKCGTLDAIAISTGLSAGAVVTQMACNGSKGAIDLSVFGGVAPFTYDWADLSGTNNPQDRSNLGPGDYSVTITDSKGCTAQYSTTLTEPAVVDRPVISITEATLCGPVAKPYITILCPITGATYSLIQPGGTAKTPTVNATTGALEFKDLVAGIGFSVTATVNGCTSEATTCDNKTNTCPVAKTAIVAPTSAKASSQAVTSSSSVKAISQDAIRTEAYPNPTGRNATITFSVAKSGYASVKVYNSKGASVATLFDGQAKAGVTNTVTLNGSALPSGIYYYKVTANGKTQSKRIAVSK